MKSKPLPKYVATMCKQLGFIIQNGKPIERQAVRVAIKGWALMIRRRKTKAGAR